MPHLFQRRDPFGNSPAIWVLCALLFLAPIAWSSLKQIRLENDIETWLPPDDPNLKVLHWAHERFPVDERIFITWRGSSLGDPRIDALQTALQPRLDDAGVRRGGSPYVESVLEPGEILQVLQENGVSPGDAVRRLQGVILGGGPLRVRLTPAARKTEIVHRPETLAAAASQALKIKIRPVERDENLAHEAMVPGFVSETGEEIAASPPAVLDPRGELLPDETVDHDFALTWPAIGTATPDTLRVAEWLQAQTVPGGTEPLLEVCFFVPGAPVALAVALSDAGVAEKPRALAAIREATEAVGIAPDDLKLGGSAVASTELNRDVTHAIWNPNVPITHFPHRSVILSSALVGALLAFVMLRSLRLAVIVLAAALYTTFLTMAIVPATGGSLNMVLVVMPTLLTVITLSGGIHVANYWRHAASDDPTTAVVQSCRTATSPCLLAALTTSIGLASLCTSSLSPVREFGMYSAIGTMLSVAMVLLGVPAMLLLWPAKPPHAAELQHPGWKKVGQLMTYRPGLQTAVSLVLILIASYGLTRFRTETKVIRYFPDASRIVQDYRFIEDHLAGIVPIETVIKFDRSAQDESNFYDRMELVRDIQEQMREHAEITGCLSLADFQPISELPDPGSVLANSRYHKRANTAEDRIRSGEIDGAQAFYNYAEQAHDLHRPGDGKLNQAGDELWRITAQVNVMTDADYADIIRDLNVIAQETLRFQPGADHVVTGAVPLFLRTQQAVLDSLVTSSFLAFGVILMIFVVQLRSFAGGLVAMIPNFTPITVVFGLISYFNVRVDIGTMITASIALGMAVDGTLHFLEWFKTEMSFGKSRPDAVASTLMHCGPAIWQTSWMVGLSLLMLVPAELLLISRFGWLMTLMVGAALIGDIVLLPQILASPLGRLFEPRQSPPSSSERRSSAEVVPATAAMSTSSSGPHFDANAASVRLSPQ